MKKLNYYNMKSNQLYSDIHNFYKAPSNEVNFIDSYTNQKFSYKLPSSIDLLTIQQKHKVSCFKSYYSCNFQEKRNQSPHSMFNSFYKYFKNPGNFNYQNNILSNKISKSENNDVYHFYSYSLKETNVEGKSIREFLSSWNDSDDECTVYNNNQIIKKQLLNLKVKKSKKPSYFLLHSRFLYLCNLISKISFHELINILLTRKNISFAKYLLIKDRHLIKCVKKRHQIIVNMIKDICRNHPVSKKLEKKHNQILKYFINKVQNYKKRPSTLFKICIKVINSSYNIKNISYSNKGNDKIIVIIEENTQHFPGLEPVSFFTEVSDQTSPWFRKKILKEKYKRKISLYKKRKKVHKIFYTK